MYSLGIIMFEVFYHMKTVAEKYKRIMQLKDTRKFPHNFDSRCGEKGQYLRETILRLISVDPKERPTSVELLEELEEDKFL